jgi:hypothetical protein
MENKNRLYMNIILNEIMACHTDYSKDTDKKSLFVGRRIEKFVLCVKQNLAAGCCVRNSLVWNEVLGPARAWRRRDS